jgi:hypothetical protein
MRIAADELSDQCVGFGWSHGSSVDARAFTALTSG